MASDNDFLKRLEVEQQELKFKIEKLYVFINSENFSKIDQIQKNLLRIQLKAMETYNQCLAERIVLLYNI